MNKFSFISSLLYRPWAIDIDHAWNSGALVQSLLNPNFEFTEGIEPEANKPKLQSLLSNDKTPGQENTISVIPITGELMKNDQLCGPAGMQTIGERIKEADQNHAIDAIMLVFDTPGGSVDGTQTLSNIIKNTQKPCVAFVDGLCASAGVWLASGCDKIIASTNMDQIGSIGVMTSFADMQPYWEAQGIKFHEVYSSMSKDKNRLFSEMRNGDYTNYIKDVLDPLAAEFRNTVKQNRKGVNADQLTGKMFFAKDVIGSLVDQIASFDEALQITSEMANEKSKTKINKVMDNLTNLSAAVGVEAFEVSDGGIFLTEDQAQALETLLETQKEAIAAIDAEKEELITKASENLEREHSLQLENQRLSGLLDVMRKQPAEKTATIVVDSNAVVKDADPCVVDQNEDFLTNLNKTKEAYYS